MISIQKPLDGLRGIAILLVLLYHENIAAFGWIGVSLFFVLSGYLITKILLEEKEKPSPLKTKFKNFWMRRALRIFPLYFLYLFVVIAFSLWQPASAAFHTEIPYLLTYTYNLYLSSGKLILSSYPIGHLWSLSVEEQFYLFYPFLVFLCTRKQLRIVTIILIVFAVLFRLFFGFYLQNHPGGWDIVFTGRIYTHTLTYFDALLSGACIFLFRLDKLKPKIKYLVFSLSFFILIAYGLIYYLDRNPGEFNFLKYLSELGIVVHYMKSNYYVWSYLLLNFFFLSVLLLLVSSSEIRFIAFLKNLFSFKPLVAIGKISYGMYVFHIVISNWAKLALSELDIALNKYLFFLFYFFMLYLFSYLVYHVYEKWFLKMKERFR